MSVRAGIVVTGTEVLSGRVTDRNGPWLSERLAELSVELSFTTVVGDRPEDMLAALGWLRDAGIDVVITSGGLGPTADDLTAEMVGRFSGRPMVLDEVLQGRIAEIVRPMRERWPDLDPEAIEAGTRKQALIPEGATILEPVGTAPGLVVPPAEGAWGPTIVVLPGPPRELQPMWRDAVRTEAFARAVAGATPFRQDMLRLFGPPESEIAETLRVLARHGVPVADLEITTCLRGGEIEIVTRYGPEQAGAYAGLVAAVRERHPRALFSEDGSSVDDQVAHALQGRSIAAAESCTGGLLAARLTRRPGASEYVAGGLVVYSNAAKEALAGVDPGLIEAYGAVSTEVAEALAAGAAERFAADVGVGITGIAGPGGGTAEKPVGTVCVSAGWREGGRLTRRATLPGDRDTIRDRTVTLAMHLIRRVLRGEADAAVGGSGRGAAGRGA